MRGFIFKWGGHWGVSILVGEGVKKKIVRWGEGRVPPFPSTMGNPASSLYKWPVDLNRMSPQPKDPLLTTFFNHNYSCKVL